jgi:hypothetical protein
MKGKVLLKDHHREKKCLRTCRVCAKCRSEDSGAKNLEAKNPLQLYAKEAEGYFFYYASDIKRMQ